MHHEAATAAANWGGSGNPTLFAFIVSNTMRKFPPQLIHPISPDMVAQLKYFKFNKLEQGLMAPGTWHCQMTVRPTADLRTKS